MLDDKGKELARYGSGEVRQHPDKATTITRRDWSPRATPSSSPTPTMAQWPKSIWPVARMLYAGGDWPSWWSVGRSATGAHRCVGRARMLEKKGDELYFANAARISRRFESQERQCRASRVVRAEALNDGPLQVVFHATERVSPLTRHKLFTRRKLPQCAPSRPDPSQR